MPPLRDQIQGYPELGQGYGRCRCLRLDDGRRRHLGGRGHAEMVTVTHHEHLVAPNRRRSVRSPILAVSGSCACRPQPPHGRTDVRAASARRAAREAARDAAKEDRPRPREIEIEAVERVDTPNCGAAYAAGPRKPIAPADQRTLKYFAAGLWTTMALVDTPAPA